MRGATDGDRETPELQAGTARPGSSCVQHLLQLFPSGGDSSHHHSLHVIFHRNIYNTALKTHHSKPGAAPCPSPRARPGTRLSAGEERGVRGYSHDVGQVQGLLGLLGEQRPGRVPAGHTAQGFADGVAQLLRRGFLGLGTTTGAG